MKKLDTDTVLEIIRMLETRYIKSYNAYRTERIENIIEHKDPDAETHTKYLLGVADGILLVTGHLQSYIEGQLNAAENQTEQ